MFFLPLLLLSNFNSDFPNLKCLEIEIHPVPSFRNEIDLLFDSMGFGHQLIKISLLFAKINLWRIVVLQTVFWDYEKWRLFPRNKLVPPACAE